jgi:ankyrin repeat protein
MTAADAGHAGMIDVLLARGAARDVKDKDGKTAFDLAADNSIRDRLRAK